ncbi:type IV inositol polyphosphate 5-phosphatase 7-like isoform X1 [Ipomoea triloba]|uniref:type IV inositol polyphosphate 5-phosphatase 7-like isoform X1 n=1 Tax=Ipomoea triloba TaxID=35885 RepID=UPI00125CE7F7|nr:type IV inositol polyphosphate 5-phosphatase 7-like isoform X1 [Ipomoea triloba]
MDKRKDNSRSWFEWWFKCRHKKPHLSGLTDSSDESDDGMGAVCVRSLEMEPCFPDNELRLFVGTWNVAGKPPVGSLAVDLDEWLNLKEAADIYVLGFQEIVPLNAKTVIGAEDPTEATKWNLLIGKILNDKYGCPWLTPVVKPISSDDDYEYNEAPDHHSGRYKLMASKKMVGVFISVWMRKELLRRYRISGVKVSSVACGLMGYLGNKGSVSVSMTIEGTSFCFVAAHLASGEKKGDEEKRNYQVSEIFRRTLFPRSPEDGDNPHPHNILGHDRIFWFGDLNYRLYLEDNLARQLIVKHDWNSLHKFDQLRRGQEDGGVFEGWREGNIEFAPTYKYSSSNGNIYSGGIPNAVGEKPRTPAWCDRILWYGKGIHQLSYFRSESKFSDHRPVSALFSTQVEALNNAKIPGRTSALERAVEEVTPTLLSLIVKDIETSPTHKQTCS